MRSKSKPDRVLRGLKYAAFVAVPTVYSMSATAQDAATPDGGNVLQEVTVTATRQAVEVSKVPISVSAFSQAQMDTQGFRAVDDLARYTPGLNISRGAGGAANISIRGIASSTGASTTGLYIDDTPIQVRNIQVIAARRCRPCSTWNVSKFCAARRARCSVRAPKAAPCVSSRRPPA